MSFISIILLLIVAHFVVTCVTGKRFGVLPIVATLVVVGMLASGLSFNRVSEPVGRFRASVSAEETVTAVMAEETTDERQMVAEEISTEELWNQLTESRIDLQADGEQSEDETERGEPAADDSEAARPAWVDSQPKIVGEVYRRVVSSDRFSTVEECHHDLELKLRNAVAQRLGQLVTPPDESAGFSPHVAANLGFGLSDILREFCVEQFNETVQSSVGPMQRVHVLMEFSQPVERSLVNAWTTHERRRRVTGVAQTAGFVLACVAFVYGLLKIDTLTRGYYTKRLLFGVPAAIIAFAVLLSLM